MRIFHSFYALALQPLQATETAVLFYRNLNRFAPDP